MKSIFPLSSVVAGAVVFMSAVASSQTSTPAEADPSAGKVPVKAIREYLQKQAIDTTKPNWKTSLPKFPEVDFTGVKKIFWVLKTNKGDIKIELLPQTAPKHVANTVYLTELGFYDRLSFHRVIPGFMAQGGCPLGTGTGSPGYKFAGEFPAGGPKHDRPGILSMANAGPGTDGSQFFLTFAATPWLDGNHTVYGRVVEGADTLSALERLGSQSGRTSQPLSMDKATIVVEE